MLKREWLAGIFLVLGAMACTGAPPAPQAPALAEEQPKYGGTLSVPAADDPFDYDMSYSGSTQINATFAKLGYSTLMRLKTGPDIGYSDRVVEPLLAERWEVSPDATTFTFHLRKGVKYANVAPVNGRELTAADVKFGYEYMARTGAFKELKGGQFKWMFEGLEGIQTPDPSTVLVKFKTAFAPFLYYAASSDNVIMPREIYEQDGHFKDRVVGTGPFQPDFAASQKGSSWLLKKNPIYFEEGRPYLDQVRIVVLPDDATEQAAFQTKQIDYCCITLTDFRRAQEIRRANPDAMETKTPYTPIRFDLSWTLPPLNDSRVRKAISLALDRDELIQTLQGGEGKWALAASNIFDDLFTQEELKSFVKYDPGEAKRLLAEAGYPNGITLEMRFATDLVTATRGELMQAQLKKAGINLVLKPMPAAEFNTEKRSRKWQITFLSEAPRSDLDSSLHLMLHPKGSFNYAGIDDPKINELLAAQRREADPEKRREVLRQLLRHANESSALIPVWRTVQYIFMQPYVKGWYHQADYRTIGSVWNTWLGK